TTHRDPGPAANEPRRGVAENLAGAGLLCHRLADARPQARVRLVVLESMVLRRLGRPRDAKARVESAGSISTEPALACELAQSLRALGESDAAIGALRLAIDGGADGAETWLDLGEALLDAGQFSEAAGACVKAREKAQNEALRAHADATAAYASALSSPDAPVLGGRLRALAETSPVAARWHRALAAYRTELPPLSDPLADIVRHALTRASRERPAGPLRVRVRVDGAPPASARAAFARGLAAMQLEGELVCDAAAPEPANDAASEADLAPVRARIAAVAETPLDVDAWCSGDAEALDVQRSARAVLESTALPLSSGEHLDAVDAVLRLEVAAMCLAARSATLDAPATIRALAAVARESDAWLGVAAIIALGGLARTLPAPASRAAVDVLADLAGGTEEEDARCRAALAILSTAASASPDERRVWFARLRAIERFDEATDGSPLDR
ncbi:MAG TPA: hypothetical protein VL400_19515, partial [Polyangiaceae bacterium]|nr:hypothetical protein [Polyangiaceae bacterium]